MKLQLFLILIIFSILVTINFNQSVSADNLEIIIVPVDNAGNFTNGCADIEYGCYVPGIASIDLDGKVIFSNTDTSGIHTFTSGTVDGSIPSPDGVFDSGILQSGNSFEYIADTEGEFPYYCMLHVWMQGMLIVTDPEIIPSTEPEVLYSMIVSNTNTIIANDHKVIDMMYSYDDKMNILDDTVNIHNGTLYTILSDLESLKRQFDGLERFPIEVNATLIDYPAILADNTLTKITGELDRIQREIDRTDIAITEKIMELEQARTGGNDELAEKLEDSLGSLILTREMRQTQMDVYDAYFEMYPQE